jgi:uncharacterized membrane protein
MSAVGALTGAIDVFFGLLALSLVGLAAADRWTGARRLGRIGDVLAARLREEHRFAPIGAVVGLTLALFVFRVGAWFALAVVVWGLARIARRLLSAEARQRAAARGYALPMIVSEQRDVGLLERFGRWLSIPAEGSILALGASGSGKTSACEHVVGPMISETASRNTPCVLYDHKEDYSDHLAAHHPERETVRVSSQDSTHTWSVFAELEAADDPDRMADRIGRALFPRVGEAGGSAEYFNRAARQVTTSAIKYLYRDAAGTDRSPGNGVLLRFFRSRTAEEAAGAFGEHDDLKPAIAHLTGGDNQQGAVWSTLQGVLADTFEGDLATDPTDDRPAFAIAEYMSDPRGGVLLLDYQGSEAPKRLFAGLVTLATRPAIAETGGRFVLDEIEKLNHRIPTLEELVNVGRARDVRVLVTLQSVAQLRSVYGRAVATALLAGFLTTLIMQVNDSDSVRFAKDRIGPDRVERTAHTERQQSPVSGRQRVTNRETRLEDEEVFGDRELQSLPVGTGVLVRRGSIAGGYIPQVSDVHAPPGDSVDADESGDRASPPTEQEPAGASP